MTDSSKHGSDQDGGGIDRRTFIVTGTGAAVSWALPIRARAQGEVEGVGQEAGGRTFTVSNDWTVRFAEPETVGSIDGTAGVDLAVRFAEVSILEPDANGSAVERIELVRTYNGQVPGPTFRLMAGDKLELKVINGLPPNSPAPPPYGDDDCHHLMALNVPGCFNTTNLHTHGLHVSPRTQGPDLKQGISSDDVLVRIPPRDDPWTTPAGRANGRTASGCRSSMRREPTGIMPISTARPRSRS